MRTYHVGHSVLLDCEGEWLDSCPEWPRHPKGIKFTDTDCRRTCCYLRGGTTRCVHASSPVPWRQLWETRGTCSCSWRMVTFQAKRYGTRECRHREGQMLPTWSGPCSREPERLQYVLARGTLCWPAGLSPGSATHSLCGPCSSLYLRTATRRGW